MVTLSTNGHTPTRLRPRPTTRPVAIKPRLPLCGTRRLPGWRAQAQAFRQYLKALHDKAPHEPASVDQTSLEAIDHMAELDGRARHLYRFTLATLLKLSDR